jgi:hypothetical protein
MPKSSSSQNAAVTDILPGNSSEEIDPVQYLDHVCDNSKCTLIMPKGRR